MSPRFLSNKKTSSSLAIFLVFAVGFILYFIIYWIISSLQILFYQRHEEVLIGSSNVVIGIIALVLSLDFYIVDALFKLAKKRYPEFYRKYYFDPNSKFKINEKLIRKFKIALGIIFISGICAVWFFFNEYISLGDRYITASTRSFVPRSKLYNYSEIQIVKRPSTRSDGTWTYEYVFSDGTKFTNLGFWDRDTIIAIQNVQKRLGINTSIIDKKAEPLNNGKRTLIVLVFSSIFFFIPWSMSKLFRKKENEK